MGKVAEELEGFVSKESESRKWLVTINNPNEHNLSHEQIKSILLGVETQYWCMADEIGEEGTYHTHLFIKYKSSRKFSTLKNLFPSAHIDNCRGSIIQCVNYVKKQETLVEGTFEESGDMPEENQGARNDIKQLLSYLEDGMDDYDLLHVNPSYVLQLDKIQKARQVLLEKKYREEFRQLYVTYVFGSAGSGKSRYVMEKEGYANCYRVTDYFHPFDTYQNQPVLIFEEFRSSLKCKDMLNYLDGYPLSLPARFNNRQACYIRVYIITNIELNKQYPDIQTNEPETWQAFIRRIKDVIQFSPNGDKQFFNISDVVDLPF